jgi:hypothetical protein
MQLTSIIAHLFTSALAADCYPTADIEHLFGIEMGTELGQLVLGTWKTLYKCDGCATKATISNALHSDTLPEMFEAWVHQPQGSGYTEKLIVGGMARIPWMRMADLEFKN